MWFNLGPMHKYNKNNNKQAKNWWLIIKKWKTFYNWKGWYERDTKREKNWSRRHVSRNCFWDGYWGCAGSLLVNYFHCPQSHSQKSWQKFTRPISLIVSKVANARHRCHSDMGIPRFGHPIPKTLVIWASPVTLTLTQIAKGMAISQGVWEWDAQNAGMPISL